MENKNSEKLKQGENYYFFQLNEIGDTLEPIEHLEPLYDDLAEQEKKGKKNKLRESSPDMMNRLRLPLLNNDPDGLRR